LSEEDAAEDVNYGGVKAR